MKKVFLDDIRIPIDCVSYMHTRIGKLNPIYLEKDWIIVRNYEQFVAAIQEHFMQLTYVSFDHDLAEEAYIDCDMDILPRYDEYKEKTGYDAAKWMKKFYEERGIDLPIMFVHSMNAVGTQNIINLFK